MSTPFESVVLGQIVTANHVAALRRKEGKAPLEMMRPIIRSLRQTLAVMLSGEVSREVGKDAFRLEVYKNCSVELQFAGREIPTLERDTWVLMKQAGVTLEPGQVILPDQVLVRELVNSALSDNGRTVAKLHQEKQNLLLASVALDTMESDAVFRATFRKGGNSRNGCASSKAA